MDFLNKLYESNYFGIGLFAVISFLVVTFLIVLFFGKKDEKRRKLEATNELNKNSINTNIENNVGNAFQETTPVTPLEMPIMPDNIGTIPEPTPVTPITPIAPINFETPAPTMQNDFVPEPIAPINISEPIPVTPVSPIIEPTPVTPVTPIINEPFVPTTEPITPIVNTPAVERPVVPNPVIAPVTPVVSEPVVTPISNVINEPIAVEPVRFNVPPKTEAPRVMEPIRITIPEEPAPMRQTPVIEPIIKEAETPIITPVINEPRPIIEEPVINDTYYRPVEKVETNEVSVPNIDFDAIAKSISRELDELEKNTTNRVSQPQVQREPISVPEQRPTVNQFSSVYITKPVSEAPEDMELPKRIDLPNIKEDNNDNKGNYNI